MQKSKILVVEDDARTRELIGFCLKRSEFGVILHASSGKEALKLAREIEPDLVLMDIMLSGSMDGIETVRRIQKAQQIPIIYLTAYEDKKLFQRAKITQPFGYIVKPFSEHELLNTIEIALYKDRQDRQLQTAREYARNIIQSSLDMIIAVDNERRIIEFNKMAETTFGYKRSEVLGKHVNLLYADVEEGLAVHKRTIRYGRCVQEIKNRHKSGVVFPSLLAASVIRDSTGKKIGVMGISRDITELKQAQQALKASQEYARNIIDSSLDMIIAVDRDRKLTEFNKAAEHTFGYRRKMVLGKLVDMLYADPQIGKLAHDAAMEKGSLAQEVLNKTKTGKVFPAMLSASVLLDDAGGSIGVVGISRDITALKQAEEDLRKSEENYRRLSSELYEANSLKELLLDVITHDLKNPAGVIDGFAGLLLEQLPENDFVKSIKDSSETLLQVIDNATTLSKVSMGEKIDKKPVNLTKLLRDIVQEYQPLFQTAHVQVTCKLKPDLVVQANPIIAEIFRNYLSNAVKYAKQGKQLVVEAYKRNEIVAVNIRDWGSVVPKEQRELIFKRTFQMYPTKKRGRGLGLAIVKRIADAHNAQVGVRPNKPRGNVFYIRFAPFHRPIRSH